MKTSTRTLNAVLACLAGAALLPAAAAAQGSAFDQYGGEFAPEVRGTPSAGGSGPGSDGGPGGTTSGPGAGGAAGSVAGATGSHGSDGLTGAEGRAFRGSEPSGDGDGDGDGDGATAAGSPELGSDRESGTGAVPSLAGYGGTGLGLPLFMGLTFFAAIAFAALRARRRKAHQL